MRQAIKLAIEWIEKQPEETPHSKYDVDTRYVVLRELEAALAQPEQDQDEVDIRSRLYQRIHELECLLKDIAEYTGEGPPTTDWQGIVKLISDSARNALEDKEMKQPEQEPVAWVRRHPDGAFTAEFLENAVIEPVRKKSGAWFPLYTTPSQRTEQEPVAWVNQANLNSAAIQRNRGGQGDTHTWSETPNAFCPIPLYTTPPQRKPQFKEFIKWADAQGYDCAQTCNSDTGEWICLNPMTADLWKAWQAAHNIKE